MATFPLRRIIPILLALTGLLSALDLASFTTTVGASETAVQDALHEFDVRRNALKDATVRESMLQSDHDESAAAVAALESAVRDIEARVAGDRDRLGAVGVAAYVGQGGNDSASDSVVRIVTMATARIRRDQRSLDGANRDLSVATRQMTRIDDELAQATSTVASLAETARQSGAVLESALADAQAPTLTAPAYSATIAAADRIASEQPDCVIPEAVLAAFSRVMSNHGRVDGSVTDDLGRASGPLRGLTGHPTPDTDAGRLDDRAEDDVRIGQFQMTPLLWAANAGDADGDGIEDPDDIFDGSLTLARSLCAAHPDTDSSDSLLAAVASAAGNAAQAAAIMGTARHLARSDRLAMGTVPADPRQQSAMERLASRVDAGIGGGSIDDLVTWSRDRLGTPYSQCLGLDVRPEDPECPPGTDRFGEGFFDCSGFVQAAFAQIGIGIPATTDAMALDGNLLATFVGETFDPAVDRPGDVLLQDGHVSLYVGDGRIIHASGGQLTEEPVPAWVRTGVFVVLRPTALA